MNRVLIVVIGWSLLIFSCTTEIEPVNPFDPASPKELQRKGGIKGKVVLENVSDIANIKVDISVKDTGYTTIADKNGDFTFTEIPQGRYTIRVVPNDAGYREVEIGNVEVGIGKVVDLGNINVFMKKGMIRGVVKKTRLDGKKEAAGYINVYVLSKGAVKGAAPSVPLAEGDRCAGKVNMSGVYSGITNGDGTFVVMNVKAGSRYVVNPVDKVLGMGYSGEVEIKEDGEEVDVGEVEIIEPSALVQVKDEEGKGIIRVTNKGKVMLSYQMAGIVQDVKVTEGGDLEEVEWKMISGGGSDVINLSEGEGEKVFSVKFRDIFCRESPVYEAKVYRDLTAPELVGNDVSKIDIDDVIVGRDGRSYVKGKGIKIRLSVYDAYHDYIKDTSKIGVRYGEGDISGNNYEGYNREKDILISGEDGEKEIRVQLIDEAGNESKEYSRKIILDTKGPEGVGIEVIGIRGADGKKYVKSREVSIKVERGDARYVRLSNDGNFENAVDIDVSVNGIIPWVLSEGDGEKVVYARFYDEVGNYTDSLIQDRVILYTQTPSSPLISINNGDEFSTKRDVVVSLKVKGAIYYALREDTQFEDSDWKEFVPDVNNEMKIPFTLSEGDGVKTLYAIFKDMVDNKSVLVFDSITVDTLPPILSSFDVAGGVKYTKSTTIDVNLSATDAYQMKISCDGINYTDWIPYTGTYTCNLSSGDGVKIVKALVRDRAGNQSEEKEATIELDTTPPINTSIVIKGKKKDLFGNDVEDTGLTYTQYVSIELEAEGATKISVSSQLLDCSTAIYENAVFTNNKYVISEYRLDGGPGLKKINVCFSDEAGNYTNIAKSASIYLDTQSPTGLSFVLNNGSRYTNSVDVKIDMVRLSDDYMERYVKFSNCEDFSDSNCNTTDWMIMPLVLPFDWKLSDGDGEKYIYMKARDGAGNESSIYFTNIILDTVAPSNAVINIEKNVTNSRSVNFYMNAEGADMVCVRGNIIDPCDPLQISKWRPFATSMQVELLDYLINEPPPNGEVTRRIIVDFMDKAGNKTTVSKTIIFDRIGPLNPSVLITGYINDVVSGKDVEDNNLTYKPNVKLTLTAEYASKVSISTDPNLDCDTANYMPISFSNNTAVIENFGIGLGSGEKPVFVCFADDAGNVSKKVFDKIEMDNEPPKNLFFAINNGDDFTTTRNVVLTGISAFDNYGDNIYMMISNTEDFKNSTGWIKLENTYNWTLSEGDGNKRVFMKVRDYAGNESSITMDSIILDTIAPAVKQILINGGADYTNSLSANVYLDVTGDVYEMKVACDGILDSEPWLVYSNTYTCLLPPGDGQKTVKAVFRDKAGNNSAIGQDTIFLDTVAPSAPRIANHSQVVDSGTYTLSLSVLSSDASPSSGFKYQCKDYFNDWYDCKFADNTNERVFTLAQDKVNRLGVRAVDGAGNISSEDYVEIIEDSTYPEPPQNIKVIEGNTRALIRWEPSPSSDVKGYKLYYGVSPNSLNGTFATEGPSPIDVGNRLDFGLSSLVNGSTFYVTVSAYDKTEVNGPHESLKPPAQYVLPNIITPEPVITQDTNGNAQDIFIEGHYAFIANWNAGFSVYDISDPNKPSLISTSIQFNCSDIYVRGNYLYAAAKGEGIKIFDISKIDTPQLLSTFNTGGTAMGIYVTGKYAYITNYSNGVVILDVSNPQSPSLVGSVMTSSYAYKIKVKGIYAYVANGSRFSILDVSDPSNPVIDREVIISGEAIDVDVSGNYAYVASYYGGIYIIDITNGNLVGNYRSDWYAWGVDVYGGYLYVAADNKGLVIFDISNPSNPNIVGYYPEDIGAAKVAVRGNYAYIAGKSKGLVILEVATPMTPTLLGSLSLGGTNRVIVSDNFAYVSGYNQNRFYVVDVRSPSLPVIYTSASTGGTIFDFFIYGNYLFVAAGSSAQIFDISDPVNPTLKGFINTFNYVLGIAVSGNYMYLANNYQGYKVVDISNISSPVVIRTISTNNSAKGVYVSGHYLYLADFSSFRIVDVIDPYNPVENGSITGLSTTMNVKVYGNYAYLARETYGVTIVDVSNPLFPKKILDYDPSQGGSVRDLVVYGKYLVLPDGDKGVSIYDIEDKSKPIMLVNYKNIGWAWAADISGNMLYVADNSFGLKIINIEP